jgi:hypothetical protein
MTVYAPSNIDSVSISGSGHAHVRVKNENNMSVSCITCEPELLKMGWARDPRDVELTFDERRDAELAREDIARFEQLKVAESAREAAKAVRAAGSTRARSTRGGAAR